MYNEKELVELILKEIKKQQLSQNNKKNIEFIGNDEILKMELSKKFNISDCAETIIVSDICIRGFCELSRGSYFNEAGERILNALIDGKEIILIEEGLIWNKKENIPINLLKTYDFYLEKIISYGIKIVKKIEILDYFDENKEHYSGKILDLRNIKKYINETEIFVYKDTKITELALEYAKDHNIKIIKR